MGQLGFNLGGLWIGRIVYFRRQFVSHSLVLFLKLSIEIRVRAPNLQIPMRTFYFKNWVTSLSYCVYPFFRMPLLTILGHGVRRILFVKYDILPIYYTLLVFVCHNWWTCTKPTVVRLPQHHPHHWRSHQVSDRGLRWAGLIWLLIIIGHLSLSGVWVVVNQNRHQKDICLK